MENTNKPNNLEEELLDCGMCYGQCVGHVVSYSKPETGSGKKVLFKKAKDLYDLQIKWAKRTDLEDIPYYYTMLEEFIHQTIQSEKEAWRKEMIEIIGKHYIAGHNVVNPILDSIIKQLT